jgi:transposase-like protein
MLEVDPARLRDDTLPRTLAEFTTRFKDDAACAEVLRRWKYGGAFRCPRCGHDAAWFIESRGTDECRACGKQTSLTAGTVMHKSSKPLRLWFLAMYLFVSTKQGISATSLAQQLGVSYPTGWLWLAKLRSAVGRRTTTQLFGLVEYDDTWEGGVHEGKRGGRPKVGEKKALIGGAVELLSAKKGFGRVRLASMKDGSIPTFEQFFKEHVAPGSTLLTDDWRSYRKAADAAKLDHIATTVSKSDRKAHDILPGVHRVFSLVHRVLLATYQGAVSMKHLPAYLAEFEFRFNRRHSASRGLLFQRVLACATVGAPPTYDDFTSGPPAYRRRKRRPVTS